MITNNPLASEIHRDLNIPIWFAHSPFKCFNIAIFWIKQFLANGIDQFEIKILLDAEGMIFLVIVIAFHAFTTVGVLWTCATVCFVGIATEPSRSKWQTQHAANAIHAWNNGKCQNHNNQKAGNQKCLPWGWVKMWSRFTRKLQWWAPQMWRNTGRTGPEFDSRGSRVERPECRASRTARSGFIRVLGESVMPGGFRRPLRQGLSAAGRIGIGFRLMGAKQMRGIGARNGSGELVPVSGYGDRSSVSGSRNHFIFLRRDRTINYLSQN